MADSFGMAGRVGHRNSTALRYPEQREAVQPQRLHYRLQIGDPVVEGEIRGFPIR
jgi:hypothetical protein